MQIPTCHTKYENIKSLLVLQNFSTARKSGKISHILKAFFSSDTRQSMKRRIATERLSKIYIARCGYTWLDEFDADTYNMRTAYGQKSLAFEGTNV